MNKNERIEKLVERIKNSQAPLTLDFYDDNFFSEWFSDDDKFDDIEPYNDLSNYFHEFSNVETVVLLGDGYKYQSYMGDIYSDLAKFQNLKHLHFNSVNIDETLEFINDGLRKITKLETFWLAGTQLKNFPKIVFNLNVHKISLLGNKFYKQNFHFKLKDNTDISLDKIKDKINSKIEHKFDELQKKFPENFGKELLSSKSYKFYFEHLKWGLSNISKDILIIKDDYWAISNSISVYVLNENEQDKYDVLNFFLSVFEELNEELKCFKKTSSKNDLDFIFFFDDNYNEYNSISFERLKKDKKIGNKKYNDYFINELVDYIGGKKLKQEIEIERQQEQAIKTEKFFRENNYIISATITNFKLFSELKIKNFNKLNILVGKNATGKTSLLQAIAIGLLPQNTDEIDDKNFWKYESYINSKENDKAEFSEIKIEWSGTFERRLQVYPKELVQDKELPQTYLALAYGENLFTNKEYSVLNHILGLDNGDYKSHNVASLFNNYFIELPNPLEVLDKLQDSELPPKYTEEKKKELIAIRKLIYKTLNDFLAEQPVKSLKIRLCGRKYKFIDSNKTELDLYQLSEGYRSNIVLITDILVKILSARKKLFLTNYKPEKYSEIFKTVKGTIIIDEFDKHLHPTWQKTFILSLRNLLPEIQFILTTHNIIALQSAEGENAYILDKPTNELLPQNIKLGYSIETIYNIFFDGNNELYGSITERMFNRFYELFYKIINQTILDKEKEEFENVTNKLLKSSEEVSTAINRELVQYEKQTGKTLL